jgi:hypothetical protein
MKAWNSGRINLVLIALFLVLAFFPFVLAQGNSGHDRDRNPHVNGSSGGWIPAGLSRSEHLVPSYFLGESGEMVNLEFFGGPYFNLGAVYAFTRSTGGNVDSVSASPAVWVLSAFETIPPVNGKPSWQLDLTPAKISAPVFAPDGKILLAGFDQDLSAADVESSDQDIMSANKKTITSVLEVIDQKKGLVLLEIPFQGEWITGVTTDTGNSYNIYVMTYSLKDANVVTPNQNSNSIQNRIQKNLYILTLKTTVKPTPILLP